MTNKKNPFSKELLVKELIERKKHKIDFLEGTFKEQRNFMLDRNRLKAIICTRRSAKCLISLTLIKTQRGSIPIKDIIAGVDKVYSPSCGWVTVKKLHDQGIQEVWDLTTRGRVIATTTLNHRFEVVDIRSKVRSVKHVKDFRHTEKICLSTEILDNGTKRVRDAYVLGVLLGDGCCTEKLSGIHVSTDDEVVVKKCATILNAEYQKQHVTNFTWKLYTGINPEYGSGVIAKKYLEPRVTLYDECCRGKKAHEKTLSYSQVKDWNLKSKQELLAGLLDSDGNVFFDKKRLVVRWCMQAKSVLETIQSILFDTYGIEATLHKSDRKHYVNGPCYSLDITNSAEAAHVLKTLPVQTERRQYKSEMDEAVRKSQKPLDRIGVVVGNPRMEQTYDIEIDTPDHLFLLANRAITHNTYTMGLTLFRDAMSVPNCTCVYMAKTMKSAKSIFWKDVAKALKRKFKIKCKMNESSVEVHFPNGSIIYVIGADDKDSMDKLLGNKILTACIDEAASFKQDLNDLVYTTLQPATADYNGTVIMASTPTDNQQGLFYDLTWDSRNVKNRKGWNIHSWDTYANPYMRDKWDALIKSKIAADPECEKDPGFLQMYRKQWAIDTDARVYKYISTEHDVGDLPKDIAFYFALGIDLGWNDETSFCIAAYSPDHPIAYAYHAEKYDKMLLEDVANKIFQLNESFEFTDIVIDGASKQFVKSLEDRVGLTLQSTDKTDKANYIKLLNSDLKNGKLKIISKRCAPLTKEWSKLIWKIKPDGSKMENPANPNHCCFVEGTQIATSKGQQPIETLKIGDQVLTRKGYFKIKELYNSYKPVIKLTLSNGEVIECTNDHPFYTKENGVEKWTQAQNLTPKMKLYTLQNQQVERYKLSKVGSFIGALVKVILKVIQIGFIERFGYSIKERYQITTTYIIKMVTNPITLLKILYVSLKKSMQNYIATKFPQEGNQPRIWKYYDKLETKQKNGTDQKKVGNGIKNTVKNILNSLKLSVVGAAHYIRNHISIKTKTGVVPINVSQPREEPAVSTTLIRFARNVIKHIALINTPNNKRAAVHVETIEEIGSNTVINLQVDGPHEYFANGILVHNCDGFLYVFRKCYHYFHKEPVINNDGMDELEQAFIEQAQRQQNIEEHGEIYTDYSEDLNFNF